MGHGKYGRDGGRTGGRAGVHEYGRDGEWTGGRTEGLRSTPLPSMPISHVSHLSIGHSAAYEVGGGGDEVTKMKG